VAKGLRIVLVLSLLLNAGFALAFLGYRSYVRHQMLETGAGVAEAEEGLLRSILSDIESAEQGRIEALKAKLRTSIQTNENTSAALRKALD
jgi:hypothetical protein